MDGRERVTRALRFENPDRAPRDLWIMPAVARSNPAELQTVLKRFPLDIVAPVNTPGIGAPASSVLFKYGRSERASGSPFVVGTYIDEWGCPWDVAEDGVVGEVKRPPLSDWAALNGFRPPWEVLDKANWDHVNRFCAETDKFVLAPRSIKPFHRIQFLRGTEAVFIDLAYGTSELLHLLDTVHEFFLKELELWCGTDVDGIPFADDWGAQGSLLISPQMWREIFKPLYADYCQMIHRAGKFAFMHSDGHIGNIIPDLIEIGVDALNSQLFCMDIEELSRQYRGKITLWGEIDRQRILPFGTPKEVREAVGRVRQAFDTGAGGVIAQLEWGKDVSRENVEAVFEAWLG